MSRTPHREHEHPVSNCIACIREENMVLEEREGRDAEKPVSKEEEDGR